jgi:hypothetical protein
VYSQDFDEAVAELISEFGFSSSGENKYRKIIAGTYSAELGEVSTTVVEYPIQAVVTDLTLQSNGYSVKYGTMVQAGDKEVFVRPPHKVGTTPAPITIDPATDVIEIRGVVYKIVTQKEVNPTGNDPILYSFYVRR